MDACTQRRFQTFWDIIIFKPTCLGQSAKSTPSSFAGLGLFLPSLALMGQNHWLNTNQVLTPGWDWWGQVKEKSELKDSPRRTQRGWNNTSLNYNCCFCCCCNCCLFNTFQVTDVVEIPPGAWWIEHVTVYEGRLCFHLTLLITCGSTLLGKLG